MHEQRVGSEVAHVHIPHNDRCDAAQHDGEQREVMHAAQLVAPAHHRRADAVAGERENDAQHELELHVRRAEHGRRRGAHEQLVQHKRHEPHADLQQEQCARRRERRGHGGFT